MASSQWPAKSERRASSTCQRPSLSKVACRTATCTYKLGGIKFLALFLGALALWPLVVFIRRCVDFANREAMRDHDRHTLAAKAIWMWACAFEVLLACDTETFAKASQRLREDKVQLTALRPMGSYASLAGKHFKSFSDEELKDRKAALAYAERILDAVEHQVATLRRQRHAFGKAGFDFPDSLSGAPALETYFEKGKTDLDAFLEVLRS